jgi:Mg2+/Co2+ transporter CorB
MWAQQLPPTQIFKHRFGHANLVVLSIFFHCSAKVAAKQNKNVKAQRKSNAKKAKMPSVKEKKRICAFFSICRSALETNSRAQIHSTGEKQGS